MPMKSFRNPKHRKVPQGFTVIELVVVMSVTGLLLSIGFVGMRDYARQQRARQATQALAWSVQVARTYAIRAGSQMTLAVDEAKRDVVVRDTAGTVAFRRAFGPKSDYVLERLDLDVDGDSLVFSRRGLCMNCSSGVPTRIYVRAHEKEYFLEIGLLGRTEMRVSK